MSFTGNDQKPVISIIVREDDIVSKLIAVDDPEYQCRIGKDLLYETSVYCTGIQGSKNDTIPVILTFSLGITQREVSNLKRVYEKGKLIKVLGEYYIEKPDKNSTVRIEIDHAVAFPLPKVMIQLHEEIMDEAYMPQWTVESEYQVNVWLDDLQPMPNGYHIHVRTAQEAIHTLQDCNGITGISLDHDLGDNEQNGTGYDVARFIEQAAYEGALQPLEVSIHSANPVERTNMESALERARCYWLNRQRGYR